jgi:hypothetical protein
VGEACDICPAHWDPGQEDGGGDSRGDACELIVLSPAPGQTLSCSGPPALVWTPGGFGRFRVIISWEPGAKPESSIWNEGWIEGTTAWSVREGDWDKACHKADGALWLTVEGWNHREGSREAAPSIEVSLTP